MLYHLKNQAAYLCYVRLKFSSRYQSESFLHGINFVLIRIMPSDIHNGINFVQIHDAHLFYSWRHCWWCFSERCNRCECTRSPDPRCRRGTYCSPGERLAPAGIAWAAPTGYSRRYILYNLFYIIKRYAIQTPDIKLHACTVHFYCICHPEI